MGHRRCGGCCGVVDFEVHIRTHIVLSIIQCVILIGFCCSLNPMNPPPPSPIKFPIALVPTAFGRLKSEKGTKIWCPHLNLTCFISPFGKCCWFFSMYHHLVNQSGRKFHLQQCTVQSQKHQFSSFSITSKIVIVIHSGLR
jgi:hypothetical protein